MSELLILCVDRDNDVGEKARIETPAIGWDAVFNAATGLALSDPEDSDLNAIFEALRIYRAMQQTDAEVVLVAGDKLVGIRSDTKIAAQIESVLNMTGAERAILVTDGTEDEEILPIIQSRMKIEAVRRVIVRQSEPLESGFYMMKRFFEEFVRPFMPFIGLVMLAFSISIFFGHPEIVFGTITGVIGFYALLKGLGFEYVVLDLLRSLRSSLYAGRVTFITYICAVILLIAGTFQGTLAFSEVAESEILLKEFEHIFLIMTFVRSAIWWYVCVVISPLIGRMMNMALEGERIVRQWTILFSVIASGLLIYGGSECIIAISSVDGNPWAGYQTLFLSILGAIIISFIGIRISRYARSIRGHDSGG